jgi:6-pyruvoyl-tetrahydropterin synthase
MFIQRVYKSTFEAAHSIAGHPKCGNKHGHSYQLVLWLDGVTEKFEDFSDIKILVDDFVQQQYDHHDIGDKTAEQIVGEICGYLTRRAKAGYAELSETAKFGILCEFGDAYAKEAQKEGGIIYQHYLDTIKVAPTVSN